MLLLLLLLLLHAACCMLLLLLLLPLPLPLPLSRADWQGGGLMRGRQAWEDWLAGGRAGLQVPAKTFKVPDSTIELLIRMGANS